MKHTLKLTSALILLLSVSCSSVKLGIPEQFRSQASSLHVKGLNGFKVKQTITFGEYGTTPIKNNWLITREGRDELRSPEDLLFKLFNPENTRNLTTSDTRYQYAIYGPGVEARVFCMEARSTEQRNIRTNLKLIGDFSMLKSDTYTFSAAITPIKDKPWQVILFQDYDAQKDSLKRAFGPRPTGEEGYATNGDQRIDIRPVRTRNLTTRGGKQVKMLAAMPAGFELSIDGGVVAIIDTFDNNIWMYNELDKPTKFIIASISSAIMLRKIKPESELD